MGCKLPPGMPKFVHESSSSYRGTDDASKNLLLQVPEDDGMKALGVSDHDS